MLFLRKLQEGGSQHSFGIHVAQMAGMPNPIVLRANEIMHFLEKDHNKNDIHKRFSQLPEPKDQLSLFQNDPRFEELMQLLEEMDVNTISPIEALLKLNELKSVFENHHKS